MRMDAQEAMNGFVEAMMYPTGTARAPNGKKITLHQLRQDCDKLAQMKPGDTEWVAAIQKMVLFYYGNIRAQSQQSFYCALATETVAIGFFVWASIHAMDLEKSLIPLIGGSLVQVVSGISFYLYSAAAKKLSCFHTCLERTHRFLLVDNLCQNIECSEKRTEMRGKLMEAMINAPLLTINLIEGSKSIQFGHKKPKHGGGKTAPNQAAQAH